MRRMVTPPQLAREWGVCSGQVLAWIRSGELRAVNLAASASGKRPRWKIDRAEVELFEARRAALPATPAPVRRGNRTPAGYVDFFPEA